MKALIVTLLLFFSAPGFIAADSTVYGPDGKRVITKSNDGRNTDYYGSNGRRITTETDQGDSKRYYDRDGRYEYDESDD